MTKYGIAEKSDQANDRRERSFEAGDSRSLVSQRAGLRGYHPSRCRDTELDGDA